MPSTSPFSSDASHQAARRWFDATLVSHISSYVDRRMIWYGLHLLAWLIVLRSCPALALSSTAHTVKVRPSEAGLFRSAHGKCTHIGQSGNEIQSLGGLLVVVR